MPEDTPTRIIEIPPLQTDQTGVPTFVTCITCSDLPENEYPRKEILHLYQCNSCIEKANAQKEQQPTTY